MISVWYLVGLFAAIMVGWLAAMFHAAGFAPIGAVSLGIGALLGFVLRGLAAGACITCRTRLVVGCVAMAVVAVLAEHAWLYREFRRQWHAARAKSVEVALFRQETPPAPSEYLARELAGGRAALWVVDALLITLAAVMTILVVPRYAAKSCAATQIPSPGPSPGPGEGM